jgi:hypothetical protein
MYHSGFKILFDGYLIAGQLLHNLALKISDLLFDGYLIVTQKKHLFTCPPTCSGHVVGEGNIELKEVLAA